MKCVNCKNEAMFEYKLTQASSIFYCGKDLPKFLGFRKQANLIPLTESFTQAREEALEKLSLEPEPVVVVEEVVEVEKPKKKAAKKKAE